MPPAENGTLDPPESYLVRDAGYASKQSGASSNQCVDVFKRYNDVVGQSADLAAPSSRLSGMYDQLIGVTGDLSPPTDLLSGSHGELAGLSCHLLARYRRVAGESGQVGKPADDLAMRYDRFHTTSSRVTNQPSRVAAPAGPVAGRPSELSGASG